MDMDMNMIISMDMDMGIDIGTGMYIDMENYWAAELRHNYAKLCEHWFCN